MLDTQHAREILSQFDWTSAVDVLLVATVIFAGLRLLSGTRVMTQLRGAVALILIFVVLGRLLDLTVVNFLVENSVTALLIAGAIIFQLARPARRDRLGRTGLSGYFGAARYEDVIDSIVKAAGRMSAERHGGLFVLERETGLQDVIDTGIPVDAKVSPELLAGIFYPNSPLHDMAVVLRDERVVAAGCVLPLANELPDRERNLGTRHRAAIGITETTDALTVVVSEETGEISVALDGRLTHVPDERRLKAVLEWVLEPGAAAAMRNGQAPV